MTKSLKVDTRYIEEMDMCSGYGMCSEDVAFTLVSSPKNGRKQIISAQGCRDFLHESVRDNLDKYKYNKDDKIPKLDFKKLRLLMVMGNGVTSEQVDNMFTAKCALNMYEKMAGWKTTSKMTNIRYRKKQRALLLTGPHEWMGHPVLLSMVTMIIRAGMMYGPLPNTNTELKKKWENIFDTESGIYTKYISKTSVYFPILMRNYKKLFSNTGPDKFRNVGHWNGGIYAMACDEGYDLDLNRKAQKLLCEDKG